MSSVLLILQLILSIILTVLVLLQRSEGGALGIGGGGGGLMSGRSATTNIVRMTSIVGAIFVVNCVALTLVFNSEANRGTLVDEIAAEEELGTNAPASQESLEDLLTTPSTPVEDDVPTVDDSAAPADEPTPPESDDE